MRLRAQYTLAILLVYALTLKVYAQINETFSDGDFTNNPTWTGNTSDFSVVNGELKSTNTVLNSKFSLSTANTLASNCQWEFYTNLQFNTSSLNLVDFYLTANVSNPASDPNANGYFVRMGGTKDEINLYKKTAGNEILLIDGRDGALNTSNNVFKVKVIRKSNNTFFMYTDSTGNGQNYKFIDSIVDNTHTNSNFFSIAVSQSTASFFGKHFFDDIYVGPILVDNTPPSLLKAERLNPARLRLTFNEAIDTLYAKNTLLYTITNSNAQIISNIIQVIPNPQKLNEIDLILGQAITIRGTYNCFVSVAKDIVGNTVFNLSQSFLIFEIKKFDLVINELMVDPSPVVGLSDAEYIELYNKSGLDINLKNSKISIGNTTKIITDKEIIIRADSFVILCNTGDTSDIKNTIPIYTKLIGIPSLPALTNEGNLVQIKDENDVLVHFISYTVDWYQDVQKKDGGYSLEQKDPQNPCGESENWGASNNTNGGTPGKKNSVFTSNKDLEGPNIIKAIAISSDTLQVYFNEKLNAKVVDTSLYFIDKGIGKPSAVAGYSLTSKTIKLKINGSFLINTLYTLTINDSIADCQGNKKNQTQNIEFALPLVAKSNEIQINEILFNPKSGGKEFIEIYNNSNNYFDLSQYALAGYDSVNKTLQDVQKISSESRLIKPFEYILISEDGKVVKQQYPKGKETQFTSMATFPSLDDKSEAIYLLDKLNNTIDYLKYNDAWHYALLKSKDGVSLERLSNSLSSNDKNNWTSAASKEDFGTPGYKNSQSSEIIYNDLISFQSSTFSPDNDGFDDLLIINYNLDNGPQSATIDVYDAAGIKIKNLANNIFISNTGTLTWDGVKDNNEKANIGNYILVMQLNDDKGKTKVIKKLFAVGAKVN
jgi:hypothetical protein